LGNGRYYTGDKVLRDADGYFWFVGKDDDVIKNSVFVSDLLWLRAPLLNPIRAGSGIVGSPYRLRGMIVKDFVVLNTGYEPSESLNRELKNGVKRTKAP
jgi:acetyl-CoA synthetase